MTNTTPASMIPGPTQGARIAIKPQTTGVSDHNSFHSTVARAALGSALGAAAAHGLTYALGVSLAGSTWLSIGVISGALIAVGGRRRRKKSWQFAMMGGALGLVGAILFSLTVQAWAPFAALLLGAACAPILARGDSRRRMFFTALVGGALSYAGLFVVNALLSSNFLGALVPGPLATALVGAAGGMFVGLSSAPRYLLRPTDPVESAFLGTLPITNSELQELVTRALAIYRGVRSDIVARWDTEPSLEPLSHRVGDLMMRILDITKQCRKVEEDLQATPLAELNERITSIESKAAAAQDLTAKKTYQEAAATLEAQRRAYFAIMRGRERVVARLHGNLALLEKIRFSLLHMRSAQAERIGEGTSPISEALEELGRELDVTSAAVGEVYGEAEALAPPGVHAAGGLPEGSEGSQNAETEILGREAPP